MAFKRKLLETEVHGGLVVSVLDCQPRARRVQIPPGQKFFARFLQAADQCSSGQLNYDENTDRTLLEER